MVTTIGNSAFKMNELTSISFSAGLTTIGTDAFRQNLLTSVQFPTTLTNIGNEAFAENPKNQPSYHVDGYIAVDPSGVSNPGNSNVSLKRVFTLTFNLNGGTGVP